MVTVVGGDRSFRQPQGLNRVLEHQVEFSVYLIGSSMTLRLLGVDAEYMPIIRLGVLRAS